MAKKFTPKNTTDRQKIIAYLCHKIETASDMFEQAQANQNLTKLLEIEADIEMFGFVCEDDNERAFRQAEAGRLFKTLKDRLVSQGVYGTI